MDLKERIKQLMTEVICHLCTKEVPHKYQIQIEGTICISSDTEPPFAIQIAQLLSKAEGEPRMRQYERDSNYGDGPGTSPGEPPPTGKNRHHSSPGDSSVHYTDHSRYHRRADCAGPIEQMDGHVVRMEPVENHPHPNFERMDSSDTIDTLGKDLDTPIVESVSPQGEIIQSTKRGSLERAPLPQKKRRRYSITQQQEPVLPSGVEMGDERTVPPIGEERELDIIVSLPTKKRESARKLASDESLEAERGGGDADDPLDERQFTVKDMVRNLISTRDKGNTTQILSDISKSLSAGQVKLVIPSIGSPPDTPLPTPSSYDDHVFDLETPIESMNAPLTPATPLTPLTPGTPLTLAPLDVHDSGRDLTLLQPLNLDTLSSVAGEQKRYHRPSALVLPSRDRDSSSSFVMSASPLYPYRSTPIPEPKSPDHVKSEPLDPNYDNKSLLTNLGHMSKEAINGLIIVDQETQKAISPQDYVYKDETTGETLIKACDYCGKHFKYLSKLMEHIRSHTKTKPYKCSICGRTYTYKGDLTVHIRQHSLAKPYVCECGRAFASKKYLSVHQSQARIKGRHAVSKDDRMGPMFECTQCGKRFKFFSSFDLHLQTHSLQTPGPSGPREDGKDVYECQACRCSFRDHVMFVEHVLEHEHGNIVSKETEKQRCQSLGALPRELDRKRRMSERTSPIKHDVAFFRPSTSSDMSLPSPQSLAPPSLPPLPSPQLGPLTSPQPLGVVLGTSSYPAISQYSPSCQSVAMFPNIQLSAAPIRMSMSVPVRIPTSMRLMNASGGTVVENRAIQGGGKMYVDVGPAPFSPNLVPSGATLVSSSGVPVSGPVFTLPEGSVRLAVNDPGRGGGAV